MKLHYPADKMKILTLGAKQKLEFEGARITIRPSKCPAAGEVFTRCAKKLISRNVKFRMQHPATLHFTYNNKVFSVNMAEEAAPIVKAMDAYELQCTPIRVVQLTSILNVTWNNAVNLDVLC